LNTCEKGPLCEEPIRGVRFNLKDAKLHTDKVHRGDNQIPTRSLMFATMLTAQPRLLEPVFGVEISVPREHVSKIYTLMTKRRGMVKNVTPEHNNITMTIEAHLPVAESFGFIQELRGETSGTAFASMVFSHWQIVPGDPLEPGTYANQIMLDVRRRKNRKVEAPKLEDYLDKL
ncbi:Elongation factor 2, partial [Yasminevirus sp. GU-2018]